MSIDVLGVGHVVLKVTDLERELDFSSTALGLAEVARGVEGVRTIALARNLGFAAANNAGIRASRGNLLLLLNSDTIVPDGAIDRLVERLLAVPEARVAGPRAMVWDDLGVGLAYAPAYTNMGGSSNVMRNIVAERILGLPR